MDVMGLEMMVLKSSFSSLSKLLSTLMHFVWL